MSAWPRIPPWINTLRNENVRVLIRNTRPLPWHDCEDDLIEILWRARVQRSIERRRALKLLNGGKGG